MFSAFKHLHMTMAILSMALLLVRFFMAMRTADALNHKFFKIVPHAVDLLFVISIITLITQVDISVYPQGFIGEKALVFILYIVFSVSAILSLRGRISPMLRLPSFILALVTWLWAVHVAFSKSPILLGMA